jgi:uncharacterized membrane protein YbhN (UPF0104 family)
MCHMISLFSILFVIFYLFKIDFLTIPVDELERWPIVFSLLLLFLGFLLAVWNWKYLLRLNGYDLSVSQCIYSVGMSVFAKYIPGKIWSSLGRASLVAQFGIPLQHAILISVHLQILFISSGLILGFIGLAMSGKYGLANLSMYVIMVVILSIVVIIPKLRGLLYRIIGKLFRKDIEPIGLGICPLLKIMFLFLVQWGFWSLGFYFLSRALVQGDIPVLSTSFAFPLSVCLGILSLISPGGIGVREGVLVGALGIMGLSLSDSTNISLVARIWFLIGEVSIFLKAVIVKKMRRL